MSSVLFQDGQIVFLTGGGDGWVYVDDFCCCCCALKLGDCPSTFVVSIDEADSGFGSNLAGDTPLTINPADFPFGRAWTAPNDFAYGNPGDLTLGLECIQWPDGYLAADGVTPLPRGRGWRVIARPNDVSPNTAVWINYSDTPCPATGTYIPDPNYEAGGILLNYALGDIEVS